MMGSVFFKPNTEMVDWIVEYADGRMIIDVGAGTGHLAKMLNAKGGKVIIIEPTQDYLLWMQIQQLSSGPKIHLLPGGIEDKSKMVGDICKDNKAMLLFARPCHSDFVINGIDLLPKGAEALYITVPENLELYDDLGKYQDEAVLLGHEGTSADNEVVYSIRKKEDATEVIAAPMYGMEEDEEDIDTEEVEEEEAPGYSDRKTSGRIKVTKCLAVGHEWDACTPGSEHDVIPCPEGQPNKHPGVWIQGKTEPCKLLEGEYTIVE